MSSVEQELADIERELMALTGNQPPNPAQVITFRQTRTPTVNDEIKTIVFEGGITRFAQVFYEDTSTNYVYLYYEGGNLKVLASQAGSPYTIVSLGAFNIV